MKKIRIANKRRFITSFVILLLIFQFMLNFIFSFSKVEGEEVRRVSYMTYEVKANDTLWKISLEYKPSYVNIFEYIREVKNINNMSTNLIKRGETLILPMR